MSYNKVFFHGAGQGIGSMMLELNQAGIPFAIKSINNVGFAVEGANLSKQYNINNQIVLRFTNPGGGGETPDYKLLPDVAAEYWANRVLDSLSKSPEIIPFKNYVWIEAMNELRTKPDPNDPMGGGLHPVEWLGMFALIYATIMNGYGYKVLAFGMNGGTPELRDWAVNGMADYLVYCSNFPEMAGVSLHEYNWGFENPVTLFPHLLGRFTNLVTVCNTMMIAPPTTFISEWGWAYDRMPDQRTAMDHWDWYAKLLSAYPFVKAAYAWNLEGNAPTLSSQMQQMIPFVTAYTKETVFPDPGEPTVPPAKHIPAKIKHTIHLMPQSIDLEDVLDIARELHPTRTAFTYSHDVVEAVLYAGNDESKVVIWGANLWDNDIVAYFEDQGYNVELRDFPSTDRANIVDMANFFIPRDGNYGDIVILENNWSGGQERSQLQVHQGAYYITKNSLYEKYLILPDNIQRILDTSPGNNEYYTSIGVTMPRFWTPGTSFTQKNLVKFYHLHTCEKRAEYQSVTQLKFEAVRKNFQPKDSPVTFDEAAEIHWIVDGRIDEKHFYAKHLGLIAWEKYDGRYSRAINVYPVGSQSNNEMATWPCI